MTLLEDYSNIHKYAKSITDYSDIKDIPSLSFPTLVLVGCYRDKFKEPKKYFLEYFSSNNKKYNNKFTDDWFQKLIACLYGRNSKTNLTFCKDITIDELSFTYLVNKYYKESGEDIFHFGEPYILNH